MKIYVSKDDYRSYSTQPIDGWETIEVVVSDDFSGGAKTYNPEKNEWEDDAQQAIDYLTPAMIERDILMSSAILATVPLQDAADLDEATEEEAALLKKWKQYRVALNRIDLSTAPDISWPEIPSN